MRWIVVLAVLLTGCVAKDTGKEDQPPTTPRHIQSLPAPVHSPLESLEEQLLADDPEHWGTEFARFELFPIPGPVERYAAICDRYFMWGGTALVFDVVDGRVGNILCLGQTEQCMYQLRVIAIEGIKGPLLEAYGMTHMGHLHYYLYRVYADRVEILINTFAVDFHHDEDLIEGGLLRPTYNDVDGDGYRDVTLAGTRIFRAEKEGYDAPLTHSEPVSKCFLFDPDTGSFHEDKTRRLGARYHKS